MIFPIVSSDRKIQAHYEACRAEGTSHLLSEMFAFAQAPTANTDREFMLGTENGRQFERNPTLGNGYASVATAMGQTVKGKKYVPGLANFPGDPEAWVDGKGDVERLLDKRGWGAEGCVNRKVQKVAEPLKIDVAEDILDREVAQVLEVVENPAQVDTEDLRDQIKQKRKGHWCK